MTKNGNNARKRTARERAAAEGIPYTEALRRLGRRAAPPGIGNTAVPGSGRMLTQLESPPATRTARTSLVGHTAPVLSVAFHPDGRLLASGGDITARVWDSEAEHAVLADESGVTSVAFSPDGGTLAIAGMNGTVSFWTIATQESITLPVCTGHVWSVAFSPDSRTLATGSQDEDRPAHLHLAQSTIRLWDLAEWQPTELPRAEAYGHAVAFHPDGRTLASSGTVDGAVHLWNVATGRPAVLTGHAGGINAVAFSPDGSTLATGSVDSTIRLWDLATGATTAILAPHAHYVTSLGFSPDGSALATGSMDSTVRLWDVSTGQAVATLFGHTDYVTSIAFSPDGGTLATGGMDRTVRLWDLDHRRTTDNDPV